MRARPGKYPTGWESVFFWFHENWFILDLIFNLSLWWKNMTLLSSGGWNPNSKSVSFTCLEISAPFGVGTTTTSNNNKNKQADVGFHELGLGLFGVYSWGRGPSPAPQPEVNSLDARNPFKSLSKVIENLDWNARWNYTYTCTLSSDIKGQPWDSSSDIYMHTYLDCSFKLTFPGLFWLCRMYGVLALAKWLPSWIFGQIKHVFPAAEGLSCTPLPTDADPN